MDSKRFIGAISGGIVILLLFISLIYVPPLLRALTVSGVFENYQKNVIFERMYVFNSSLLHIWFGIGTTKYLPYDPNDASTVFRVVAKIVREGWVNGSLLYANWDPENFNKWEVYVKWSFRNMGYYDRQYITPHGWILSTEDIGSSSYTTTWIVSVGGKGVEAGFTVELEPADSKETYVPQYGDIQNGWLYLGWGLTNRYNTWWPYDLNEYKTTGVFLMAWKNNYMQNYEGESLHIKILSKVKYSVWKLNLPLQPPLVPYGAWILVWPATLGDGSYDNDGVTEVVQGYEIS